jgi:hypothetical protein
MFEAVPNYGSGFFYGLFRKRGQRGFHHTGRIRLRASACLRLPVRCTCLRAATHRQARTVKDPEGAYQKGLGSDLLTARFQSDTRTLMS